MATSAPGPGLAPRRRRHARPRGGGGAPLALAREALHGQRPRRRPLDRPVLPRLPGLALGVPLRSRGRGGVNGFFPPWERTKQTTRHRISHTHAYTRPHTNSHTHICTHTRHTQRIRNPHAIVPRISKLMTRPGGRRRRHERLSLPRGAHYTAPHGDNGWGMRDRLFYNPPYALGRRLVAGCPITQPRGLHGGEDACWVVTCHGAVASGVRSIVLGRSIGVGMGITSFEGERLATNMAACRFLNSTAGIYCTEDRTC